MVEEKPIKEEKPAKEDKGPKPEPQSGGDSPPCPPDDPLCG